MLPDVGARTEPPEDSPGGVARGQIEDAEAVAQRARSGEQHLERILPAGEEKARAAVRAMPDGEWEAEDWMDNDGVNDDLVRVHVRVAIEGDAMTID